MIGWESICSAASAISWLVDRKFLGGAASAGLHLPHNDPYGPRDENEDYVHGHMGKLAFSLRLVDVRAVRIRDFDDDVRKCRRLRPRNLSHEGFGQSRLCSSEGMRGVSGALKLLAVFGLGRPVRSGCSRTGAAGTAC